MEREATFQYQILRVPDRDAANCLYINGTLIHRAEFHESTKVFNELACETLESNISEIAKAQVFFHILLVCFSCVLPFLFLLFGILGGLDLLFYPNSKTETHQEPLTLQHF